MDFPSAIQSTNRDERATGAPAADCGESGENNPTIVEALGMFRAWSPDVPPCCGTSIKSVDIRLADAFRKLIELGGTGVRLTWLEAETFIPRDHLPPEWDREASASAADPYRATLIRWWLDIEEAARA